jgi:hypothetical protein
MAALPLAARIEIGTTRIGGLVESNAREIEELLYTYPKVKNAQVAGIQSDKDVAEVAGFVQLKPGEEQDHDIFIGERCLCFHFDALSLLHILTFIPDGSDVFSFPQAPRNWSCVTFKAPEKSAPLISVCSN